jgi:hypothetical protein
MAKATIAAWISAVVAAVVALGSLFVAARSYGSLAADVENAKRAVERKLDADRFDDFKTQVFRRLDEQSAKMDRILERGK